jgi:hypothetical protein
LHAEPESSLLDSQMKDHLSVLLQLVGADSIDDDRPHRRTAVNQGASSR